MGECSETTQCRVSNSGRSAEKSHQLAQILSERNELNAFARFMALSDWLYTQTDATFRIEKQRLNRLVNEWLALSTSSKAA